MLIVISIIMLASCAAPGSNGNEGTDTISDIGTELTVTAKSIGTVSPYTYGVAGAKAANGPSYLSFNTPDSTVFQPLVFESGSGTKVVFENATINQIDEDFYYIDGTLQTIRKEPVVQYKDSGEDDAEDNPIMVASTVEMDVIRSYGDCEAILDMRDGSVYLLTPSGILVLDTVLGPGIWATDDYLYFEGYPDTDPSAYALYRISKDGLPQGTIKQLTNAKQGYLADVAIVTDDYALLGIIPDGSQGISPYLLDIKSDNPAFEIVPSEYKDALGLFADRGKYYYNGGFNTFINGDLLYDFHKNGTDIVCNILRIMDGSLSFERQVTITGKDSDGLELEKLSSADAETGLLLATHYDTRWLSDSLIRVNLNGTNVTVDEVVLDGNDKTAAHFETVGDRVYWIAGASDNDGSLICYHDFGTGSTVRKPIPGKSVVSSDLSVSEDGTVVYTQFMDIVDTATFSWNPDKEEEPTLLMLEEADVHSIVSINKL